MELHRKYGSAKVVYDTPETIYVGGSYTLDIGGVKTSQIARLYRFPIRSHQSGESGAHTRDKLSPSQVSASIDGTTGKVRVTWKDIHTASLLDTDWIGQIRYDLKEREIISLVRSGIHGYGEYRILVLRSSGRIEDRALCAELE